MKLRVLGASGSKFPNMNPPAFMLDGSVLLDAGSIASVLTEAEQDHISHILLSHSHLDHVLGIPFLADNLIIRPGDYSTVKVMGTSAVLNSLHKNLLNGEVWPDFTAIPSANNPVLSLRPIETEAPFVINGYTITAYSVNHSVPAVGFVVESAEGRRLLYSGDTGPTDAIWRACDKQIHCAIIETSMPNSMNDMAILTGHLTPALLGAEIAKMAIVPERVLITHPKPQHWNTIKSELDALGIKGLQLLRDGEEFEV